MKFIQSINWLANQIKEEQGEYILFDCRYDLMDEDAGELAYREGHISGAFYAHLSLHLSSAQLPTGEGGRHALPLPEVFATFLSERGVKKNSIIIAYDNQGGAMASRLRWLLKWVGHKGEIYIIEEGYKGWVEAGYPIEIAIPSLVSGEEYSVQLQENMLVKHDYVFDQIGNDNVIIIDSRDGARYRGEVEPIDKKAGHIPTALNYFWTENKDRQGKWKDEAALVDRFSALDKDKEIIVYCGSGVTATPNVFALQEAGFHNVKLYAGSWSEWSSLEGKPVAIGIE